jgi:hypothetical protein
MEGGHSGTILMLSGSLRSQGASTERRETAPPSCSKGASIVVDTLVQDGLGGGGGAALVLRRGRSP